MLKIQESLFVVRFGLNLWS